MKTLYLAAVLLFSTACSSPLRPTLKPAHVEQHFHLTIDCDGSRCSFSGTAVNVGETTAYQVTGVTSFSGHEVAVQVPATIPAGGSVSFSGSLPKLAFTENIGHGNSRTTFRWVETR